MKVFNGKQISQSKPVCLQLKPMMHMKVLSASMAVSFLSLTGCQSLSAMQTSELNQSNPQLQAEQAKSDLQKALNRQLKSSFYYQTDIKLSNAPRRQALANATPEQLSNVDDKNDYCEHTHDIAYVALLKKADKAELDIKDSVYAAEREEIKTSYQSCKSDYADWYEAYYYGSDIDKDGTPGEYLPDYDIHHTAKDAKVATIRHEYLFKPFNMQISGIYQPKEGKFTMLPSASFKSRNLLLSINQPIYLDFKKGNLYFLADTFAYPISELADDKLGSQWYNKWLKISLNDDDLPKGIGKKFLTVYVEAMNVALEESSSQGYQYLSPAQLSETLPYLSPEQQSIMSKSHKIISINRKNANIEYQRYLFSKTLYNRMFDAYPGLFENDSSSDMSLLDKEISASSMEEIKNGKFAKALLKGYLQSNKEFVDEYERDHLDENGALTVELEELDDKNIFFNSYIEHYGIQGGKIKWMHKRYQFNDSMDGKIGNFNKKVNVDEDTPKKEGKLLEAMTTFSSVNKTAFPRLPASVQIPTEDNSIDVKEYLNELSKYYESGGGTAIGKIIYGSFNKYIKNSEDAVPVFEEVENETMAEVEGGVSNRVYESPECVVMEISLDMMCTADDIDINNAGEVTSCEQEKQEMSDAFKEYCGH